MVKLLSTFLSASILFILSFFFGTDPGPQVTVDAPASIRSGESAEVRFTINKGATTGFARLQLFLPEGLTADGGQLENSQFLHEEDYIKFIWLELPEDSVFTVSIFLHTQAEFRGIKYLNGFFSYLEGDLSRKTTLQETAIAITPDAPSAGVIQPPVTRRIIAVLPEAGEYRVELDIRPKAGHASARFIDQLPSGFIAEAISLHGGVFSVEDGKAVIRWAELPADSQLTVSYLVRGPARAGAPAIEGMLVYGEEAIDLNDELAEEGGSDADHIVDQLLEQESERTTASSGTTPLLLPAPQGGLYFTVQVAATRKSPVRDNAWFSKHYRLSKPVDLTQHEGWNKYLIGQFPDYQTACRLRDQTRDQVSDAFIVAYDENGQRIPIGQALNRNKLNQ